jgi:hypothetical protein
VHTPQSTLAPPPNHAYTHVCVLTSSTRADEGDACTIVGLRRHLLDNGGQVLVSLCSTFVFGTKWGFRRVVSSESWCMNEKTRMGECVCVCVMPAAYKETSIWYNS